MLEIQTKFGNFGSPKDLLLFMQEEAIESLHVCVRYCMEPVIEREIDFYEVRNWAQHYVGPIVGCLEQGVRWLKIGLGV